MKSIGPLVLLLILPAAGQVPRAHKISDSYAKCALLALKTIEADDSSPQVRDGGIYGNWHTINAINAADAEAVSRAEQMASESLNAIYSAKLLNNSHRDLQRQSIEMNLEKNEPLYSKAVGTGMDDIAEFLVNQKMDSDSKVVEIKKREHVCFSDMSAMLRSRVFARTPESCNSMAAEKMNQSK